MKINGGKSRKRRARYWLELNFAWQPSFIVDFKQESRVNDNRKQARLNAIYRPRQMRGRLNRYYWKIASERKKELYCMIYLL